MRLFLLTLFLISAGIPAIGQKKLTLSGYVKDAASGESLIGSAIYVQEAQTGASTNTYGFYSISLPPGSYTISYTSLGYLAQTQTLNLIESRELNIDMEPHNVVAEEVVISDIKEDHNVESTQMGVVSLTTEQIKKLPVIFGESDILKAIQLLPGVQSAGEGQSGFYVRGGGPDQNLVLLDDAVVYNTGHLFGFFSVFNSDAIKNVTLIKGGMPANYGGRLSSVVDVSMKEGNSKEYHGEGGIGLIASRLTLEGPIVKEKGSFMLSGRRTYIDLIAKPLLKGKPEGPVIIFTMPT